MARSLARRGHVVLHVQCESYTSGKGSFQGVDGGNPRYVSISLEEEFARYQLRRRLVHELRYARRFVAVARSFRPDLIVSCNDPLLAKAVFGVWAAARRVPWVFWLQDLYSVAMAREASSRSGAGRVAGRIFQQIERRLLRAADGVVSITSDFDAHLDGWGVDRAKRTVIENWAPLDELPLRPRNNAWRTAQGLGDSIVYLYSGTLGLKHNPDVLFVLAESDPTIEVVVVSEGLGAERLRTLLVERPIPNLRVLPFQPWESLPDVLGAADVLLVLLEAEAGVFSVPSKVLTCLCAGRPILAAMPTENCGARTIVTAQAGVVLDPGAPDVLVKGARALRDPTTRAQMGLAGRSYAERAFAIEPLTDRFEAVLGTAVGALGTVHER